MDNAIEASIKCPPDKRWIIFEMYTINNMTMLRVVNNKVNKITKFNGRFISSKKNKDIHGWGIENIKQIVKKYNGDVQVKYDKEIFEVCLNLNSK